MLHPSEYGSRWLSMVTVVRSLGRKNFRARFGFLRYRFDAIRRSRCFAGLIVLLFVAFAAKPLAAREKSDVIVMKNGDRITCEIKQLRSDTLYIKVGYILTTLSVDWTQVDHLESKQLFLITTRHGNVYTGTLSAAHAQSAELRQIEIFETPDKKAELPLAQVAKVDETSNLLRQRFSGQVGLGFTYSKGNQTSQYNLASDVSYSDERWSAGVDYASNLTSNSSSNVSTRNDVTLSAQRRMRWNNWYYTGIADFLQSSVQGIQLQDTFGAGIGRTVTNTGHTFFTVYGGFGWQQIDYQQRVLSGPTQQVTSGLVGAELRLFRFDRTDLTINATLLPAITDPGRVHFNLNAAYYVKLWRKLNWNCTFYGNWDNRPPPGFSTSDYGASSGISLNFGSR
jgi:putative salt-induced outer membrane protein YdiY